MKKRILKGLKFVKRIIINNFTIYLLLTTFLILFLLYNYVLTSFSNLSLEQIIYTLKTAGGTSKDVIYDGAIYIAIRIFIFYLVLFGIKIFIKKFIKTRNYLIIKFRNKKIRFSLWPISNGTKFLVLFLIIGYSLVNVYNHPLVNEYMISGEKSEFFDKYYIDPNVVEISAPTEKQNLIYIYVESLETSMVTEKNGGAFTSKIIPNLEKMALDKDNIHFSHTDSLGGGHVSTGSDWTIAGLVSSSAGVPLKIPISSNEYFSTYGNFLQGAVSLGDIFKENGYSNYFMLGSDSHFGGRDNYFTTHGDYNIYDYYYAKEKKWIDKDYKVWWGYEDKKLFENAKDVLKEISNEEEPFNFTLLTADTHFVDGYSEESCEKPFDEQYLNVYHCSDSMISDFVNWVKKQDFYEDTTIVIVGDHLTMQANIIDMFEINNKEEYERTVYNLIINSKVETKNTKNRKFTTFDLYPTVLASLGFKIEGDKLALGTNLFSEKETLSELLGYNKVDNELSKKSDYYIDKIIGSDSYGKMMQQEKEK